MAGRPRLIIDWEAVKKLCHIQCTRDEIASFLQVSNDTLERAVKREHNMDYAAFYKQHADGGKRSLRRKMFEVALNGNVGMLIWLSKQQLGMREDPSQSISNEDAKRVFELAYKISKPDPVPPDNGNK